MAFRFRIMAAEAMRGGRERATTFFSNCTRFLIAQFLSSRLWSDRRSRQNPIGAHMPSDTPTTDRSHEGVNLAFAGLTKALRAAVLDASSGAEADRLTVFSRKVS